MLVAQYWHLWIGCALFTFMAAPVVIIHIIEVGSLKPDLKSFRMLAAAEWHDDYPALPRRRLDISSLLKSCHRLREFLQ